MTAERADRGGRRWAARPWRLSSRASLRTKLVTALVTLVICALAALGVIASSILRGYLLGPYDQNLQATVGSPQVAQCVQAYVFNVGDCRLNSDLDIYWLTSNGKLEAVWTPQPGVSYVYQQEQNPSGLPALAGMTTWLTANAQQATTVPAQSGRDRWRTMGLPVTFKNLQTGVVQSTGTIIVAEDVTTVYTTIQRLIWMDLIVSVAIVGVLALVGFAVVRANLRPLVEIEETAGEIAAGHLNQRVPERDPRTEIGSLGRSLNTMLSQIETAFHAREESEAAAHQSEERMRRFIADASHELRTPLTAIRGFAEYYRQRGGLVRPHADLAGTSGTAQAVPGAGLTPDDLDRIMQRVEKEAARMGLLVEDLLLLARLDQQRPLAWQPIDLLSLAADAVHDTRMLAPGRTISLSVQPGAAFLATGDEPRLRQVIGNLMSNALTHTPDGTPIEVSISSGTLDPRATEPSPAVILDVTDHGPGMTPEQAHRVFERFYRADQARTRVKGGNGLGLAIVSALVAAHGGVASVRTAPDRGATFRVTLPLAPEAQGGLSAEDDFGDELEQAEAPGIDDEASGMSVTYGTAVGASAGAEAGAGVGAGAELEDYRARAAEQTASR